MEGHRGKPQGSVWHIPPPSLARPGPLAGLWAAKKEGRARSLPGALGAGLIASHMPVPAPTSSFV